VVEKADSASLNLIEVPVETLAVALKVTKPLSFLIISLRYTGDKISFVAGTRHGVHQLSRFELGENHHPYIGIHLNKIDLENPQIIDTM